MNTDVLFLFVLAVFSVAVGLTMLLFRRSVGVAFCRLGKFVFQIFRSIAPINAVVNFVYDEKRAPMIFAGMGVIFIAQGFLVLFVASIIL